MRRSLSRTSTSDRVVWLADGHVVAAMNANLCDDGDELLRLVESGARVDVGRLADPTIKLAEAA